MKKYLLYVREYSFIQNKYVLNIYKVETNDIFHTLGEYKYRSLEEVKRIDFIEWTKERENYWLREGYVINSFKNKYDGNGDVL